MQSTKLSVSSDGVGCGVGGATGAATTAATRGTVTEKVEPWPGAEESSTGRSSMRAMRSTMARPRPSPRSSRGASSSACRRTNSSKITACLSAAMPGPLSLTSMRSSSPTRRQPSSTRGRPALGLAVAQRIGQQVLQDAAQEGRVGRHEGTGRHDDQFDAAARRHRGEGGGQRLEQRLQGERPLLRLEGAGVELGDVEQRVEQRFDRAQAGVDLAAEIVAGIAIDHRRGEQARGVQGLQQVVARRGDEARLAEIGGLRLGAARLELGRALDHALLERLGRLAKLAVAFAQRLGGMHARRHVVAGGDEAAAGQRIEAQFDDAAFAGGDFVGLRRLRATAAGPRRPEPHRTRAARRRPPPRRRRATAAW